MMDDPTIDEVRRQARSFGSVAERYDRGRPGYPAPAVRWLVGRETATVLELGAGTGKLTAELVAQGYDVHATEPDPEMLAVLRKRLPDVPTSEAGAEEIPLPDRSVDVVVVGQAFHWFDHDLALPEIARVLRPGGHLVVSDQRGLVGDIISPVVFDGPALDNAEGELGYIPVYARLASEYLAAALPLGFQVLRCEEPRVPSPLLDDEGRTIHDGERLPPQDPKDPPYTWALHAEAIDATNAAWRGKPSSIIWHFQLPPG